MKKSTPLILKNASSLLAALVLFFPVSNCFSAEADFYTLNDKWEKANASSAVAKKAAIEQGFSSALEKSTDGIAHGGFAEPPAITRTLSDLVSQGQTIEIQLKQSLFIKSPNDIVKFVTTSEGIVSLETVGQNTLRILGTGIGRSFVHIWNASGRNTFEIQVISPVVPLSSQQLEQIEKFEKTRPFKFGYDNSRSASYAGSKFRDETRSSLDFTQNFNLNGDTPYGSVDSSVQTQKDRGKTLLTDAQFNLRDGHVGPLRNFNLGLGDNRVTPDLMVFPGTRVRGYHVDHTGDDKRVKLDSFYGREQSSVVGTLAPGVSSQNTLNSYLSGNSVDYKVNDDAKLKAGFFTGSGHSRSDELNKRGAGVESDIRLGPHFTLNPEVDYDNERFAQKHAITTSFDKITVKTEARDIDTHFETLIGSPSRQGEKGYLIDMTADPFTNTSFSGTFDIFRDRLIPNPSDVQAYNRHTDLLLRVTPAERSNLLFTLQDLDDTGRIGPTKQTSFGTQFNQQFDLFGHKATAFSRYQYRVSRNITDPSTDYRDDQLVLGFQTAIFWDINFSLSQEWNWLDEYNLSTNQSSSPRVLIYAFDYSHQIGNTPFYIDARLRIRDEEEAESRNSFMTGEDSTEVSGSIFYREYDNMEIFLTGRFENFVPESLNVTAPRVEAEFLTGMRYVFDSGYRWSAVGSFEGFVFKDMNSDGIRQPEEPGIEGMTIRSNDGREAITDKQGFYELKSVTGKNAVLALDNSKIPYGFAPTSDVRKEIPIVQGETEQVDFGMTPRSEITGIIFNDLNGNGRYDSTDIGVRKVRVKLEDGTAIRSNSLGVYSFSAAVAGEHTASLDLSTLPEGYLPLDVPKKTFTVFEGIRYELNFPLRATRQVTGRVFIDQNGNGVLGPEDKVLENAKVLLGSRGVLTDKDGWYLFDNLNSGAYELSIDPASLPEGISVPKKLEITLNDEPVTISDKNIPLTREH